MIFHDCPECVLQKAEKLESGYYEVTFTRNGETRTSYFEIKNNEFFPITVYANSPKEISKP